MSNEVLKNIDLDVTITDTPKGALEQISEEAINAAVLLNLIQFETSWSASQFAYARKTLGISQEYVAEELGVDVSRIADREDVSAPGEPRLVKRIELSLRVWLLRYFMNMLWVKGYVSRASVFKRAHQFDNKLLSPRTMKISYEEVDYLDRAYQAFVNTAHDCVGEV